MESAIQCLNQFQKAKRIAIMAHKSPDADAVCSCVALKRLIKKTYETDDNRIDIDIFLEGLTDKYAPFTKGETINVQNFKRYDLAICLDCPSSDRTGIYQKIFKRAKDTLNIDHHETNSKFASNNIVSICSSTCEILYSFFIYILKWEATPDIYRLLYAGILTDTNNLSQNITKNTLKIISKLMQLNDELNLNLPSIKDYFFKSNTVEQITLLQRALNSIMFYEDNKIAVMKLVKQDFNETGASKDDTLGIVDYAISIKGVEIGVIFIKNEDNTYYVSLRSRNEIDVGEVAKQMGGGGHHNIAAFQTKEGDTLADIKAKLFALCKIELEKVQDTESPIENLFVEEKGPDNEPFDEESENAETISNEKDTTSNELATENAQTSIAETEKPNQVAEGKQNEDAQSYGNKDDGNQTK